MGIELLIQNGSMIYVPVVEGELKLSWERKGTPGKLEFSVIQDDILHFEEGNPVKLTVDDTVMFYGFVFSRRRKAGSPVVSVTAYDQTRYLKNKDTLLAEGMKASDLLKRLADDFRLRLGTVEDTEYVIESIVEENTTLFDMLQNALDETLLHTGRLYCLYDDAGTLTLKELSSMKLNLLIDEETAETYDYSSGIDGQTYNKIKLAFDNEETGKREIYVAQDGEHINQWGVLQYFEMEQTATGAAAKAETLLKLYNRKSRNLSIQNAFGDVRVRAGSGVAVLLHLDDLTLSQYMLVEKVVHHWKEVVHGMDLTLIGGEFFD